MEYVFFGILIIHALVHSLGFIKGFRWAEIPQLSKDISYLEGFFWFLSCTLFLAILILFAIDDTIWAVVIIPAIILSETLIVVNWKDAKFGTILNLAILFFALWKIFW